MSGIMYRTSPVVIENNTLQAPSRRGPVRPVGAYFPDNDLRSVQHYPLHIGL
jgi:hypothetical protein